MAATTRTRVLAWAVVVVGLASAGAVMTRLMISEPIRVVRSADAAVANSTIDLTDGSGDPVVVSGSLLDGLYPTAERTVELNLTNPRDFAIQLNQLWATLDATSEPACQPTEANLILHEREGVALPVTVAAGQTVSVGAIPVQMPYTADDACIGANFTITLHGEATKVTA